MGEALDAVLPDQISLCTCIFFLDKTAIKVSAIGSRLLPAQQLLLGIVSLVALEVSVPLRPQKTISQSDGVFQLDLANGKQGLLFLQERPYQLYYVNIGDVMKHVPA